MFDIRLYSSFNKRPNSTKKPTGTGTVLPCQMKSSSSILFPVVDIKNVPSVNNVPLYSYAYIDVFQRYYWIDDIEYDLGTWTLSMHCDALATFHDDIMDSTQYVIRSSSNYDGGIMDTMYLTHPGTLTSESKRVNYAGINGYQNRVWVLNTDGTYSDESFFNTSFTSGYFVLGIVGNNTAGVTYYSMSNSSFKNFINNAFSLTPSNMNDVSAGIANAIFNPMQYITYVRWFPIEPHYPNTSTTSSIMVGGYTIPGSYTAGIITSTDTRTVVMKMAIPKHSSSMTYRNLSPYTELSLYFQPFGVIPLDTTKLINSEYLVVHVVIDFCTGSSVLNLYSDDQSSVPAQPKGLIYSVSTQYGVDIPVSTLVMDWRAGAAVSTMQFLKTAVQDFTNKNAQKYSASPSRRSAGSSSGPAINTRTLPERAESLSAVDLLDKAMDLTASALGQVSTTGAVGSFLAYRDNLPYILAWFKYTVAEDNARFGRPLYQTAALSTLSGFCICMNASITSFSKTVMEEEINTIISILNSGVFLE